MEQKLATGLPMKRLVNPGNRNLDHLIKCNLCFEILLNPHDCDKCGHTFCFDCINSRIKDNKPCAFNCENYSVKPSSLVILTCLNNLKFSCVNKDCDTILDYLQVLSHDKICHYAYTVCPNSKCNKSVKRQVLEYHLKKECEYSEFKCENCEMSFPRGEYLEHIKNCKIVSDIFENPIQELDFNKDNQSLISVLRILLIQIARGGKETNKKLEMLNTEISNIKEEIKRNNSNNNLILENMNNEIESISDKVTNIEVTLVSTGDMKKILTENLRETVLLKENITKTKDATNNSNSVINSKSPSSNNSMIMTNATNLNSDSNINPSHTTNNNIGSKIPNPNSNVKSTNTQPNIKKISFRSSYKGGPDNPIRSPPNRSPVNTHNNSQKSPNSKNYETETESFGNKTSNVTLLKSMIKNQETIMEKLARIQGKIEILDSHLNLEMKKNEDNLKFYMREEIFQDLKGLIIEASLDNCSTVTRNLENIIGRRG